MGTGRRWPIRREPGAFSASPLPDPTRSRRTRLFTTIADFARTAIFSGGFGLKDALLPPDACYAPGIGRRMIMRAVNVEARDE
jgi:hypothetical protein